MPRQGMKIRRKEEIQEFDFEPGEILSKKYQVEQLLGKGYEGEVYLLKEIRTGIRKTGKFFFPHRNLYNRTLIRYARQLHKLRNCDIIIHYYTEETILYQESPVHYLVSEFVEGELLSSFLKRQKGQRLLAFQAIHFLYALVSGIEKIHQLREYHGDLHSDNIIVRRFGLGFELKLIDMYSWNHSYSKPESVRDDVYDMVRLFYDVLGGAKYYARQPRLAKEICCGLKKSLMMAKFRNSTKLREFLERLSWE